MRWPRTWRWWWVLGVIWLIATQWVILPALVAIELWCINRMPPLDSSWFYWAVKASFVLPILWLCGPVPWLDASDRRLRQSRSLRLRLMSDRLLPWAPLVIVGGGPAGEVSIAVIERLAGERWFCTVSPRDFIWVPILAIYAWVASRAIKARALKTLRRFNVCPACGYPVGRLAVCTECGWPLPRPPRGATKHESEPAKRRPPRRGLPWLWSRQAMLVCEHMTRRERDAMNRRAMRYGLWCAATGAVPLVLVIAQPSAVTAVVAIVLLAVHLAVLPRWLAAQRRFLCSTRWAREQGISPDQLKRFARRQRSADADPAQ